MRWKVFVYKQHVFRHVGNVKDGTSKEQWTLSVFFFFSIVSVPLSWSGSGRHYRRWPAAWSWSAVLQRCGWSRPSALGPSDGEMTEREREKSRKSVSYNSYSATTTRLRSRHPGATSWQVGPSSWCKRWICFALCLQMVGGVERSNRFSAYKD